MGWRRAAGLYWGYKMDLFTSLFSCVWSVDPCVASLKTKKLKRNLSWMNTPRAQRQFKRDRKFKDASVLAVILRAFQLELVQNPQILFSMATHTNAHAS